MSFIEQLQDVNIADKEIIHLKNRLVATYQSYLRTQEQDNLEAIIKLSYMIGKKVAQKELMRNGWICSKKAKELENKLNEVIKENAKLKRKVKKL